MFFILYISIIVIIFIIIANCSTALKNKENLCTTYWKLGRSRSSFSSSKYVVTFRLGSLQMIINTTDGHIVLHNKQAW